MTSLSVVLLLACGSWERRIGLACAADPRAEACDTIAAAEGDDFTAFELAIPPRKRERMLEHVSLAKQREAVRQNRESCERGEAWGCMGLADCLAADHLGCEQDLTRAAALFDQVCHHTAPDNHPWGAPWGTSLADTACVSLGDAYHYGRGVPRSTERARALYSASCAKPTALGCSPLAHLRFQLDEPRADIVPTAARGCDVAEDAGSCLLAACLALGPSFDPEMARWFEQGCDTHDYPMALSCKHEEEAERCAHYFERIRRRGKQ
ncbi:MAG: hypothetical protein KTR31_14740 [Myxococcales bacterium]|nr:hypothetical protein [Myxococcales bacterium]